MRRLDPLSEQLHPLHPSAYCPGCQKTTFLRLGSVKRDEKDKIDIYSYDCESCGRFIKSVNEKYKEIHYGKRKTKRLKKPSK